MIHILAQAAPIIQGGAQTALNNMAFLDDMVKGMQQVGNTYGVRSLQFGGALFASLSTYRLVSAAREYSYTHNGSMHGCERGLMDAARKLLISGAIMAAVGAALLAGLDVLVQAVLGEITGVHIVGPFSILALGAVTMLKLVQQPLAMVIAGLPTQTPLPFGLDAPMHAVQMAQNVPLLILGAGLTCVAAFISLFIVGPCFAWITVQYIAALVNIAFVLPLREFEMGWAASPGTEPWSADFYSDVRKGFVSLLIIGALAVFIYHTITLWGNETAVPATGPINLIHVVQTWVKITLGSIVCLGLAIELPKLVHGSPTAFGHTDITGKK